MSENSTLPYVLQLKDAVNEIHLSESDINNIALSISEPTNITILPSYDQTLEQVCIQPGSETVEKLVDTTMEVETPSKHINFVYEIVYPEQLNLKPAYNLKRGRPKKKRVEEPPAEVKTAKPAPRTRSGRVVKFPKYIEKDFKKVEMEDSRLFTEQEVKTTEFVRCEDIIEANKKINEVQLDFHQRRRKISSQYRCPKCKKIYLGKTKMMQHIKKYPDHGPLPLPHNDLNFDVWNYLVDITQKCPPAQRGIKFCEELTNLLHNVLLLTSALFKKVEKNKNYVDVDKVLGNAIGLAPGSYKFNENELYKDVTVLKLITNSDFFKPVSTNEETKASNHSEIIQGDENGRGERNKSEESVFCATEDSKKVDLSFVANDENYVEAKTINRTSEQSQNINNTESVGIINGLEKSDVDSSQTSNFIKKSEPSDDRLAVHTELLSENALLNLPNLRNSVDELILSGVDSSTNLLDNSTSSDEVMNVDQFVNERFKKITEPEIELNVAGLNLDLPNLDLFQFHPS